MAADDLEGRVAGPHEATGAEVLVDAAEEGLEIGIGGLFFAKGVEGRGLHLDVAMAGEGGEGADIGVANAAVGTDAGEVIDDDGRIGKAGAHAVESREMLGAEEGADGQILLGAGSPEDVAVGGFRIVNDAEATDALGGEIADGFDGIGAVEIDDADAAEDAGVGLHAVQHVGVVRTIEAHLDEDDAGDLSGLGMAEEIGGGEGHGRVIALAGYAGIGGAGGGPKVDVGVDDRKHVLLSILSKMTDHKSAVLATLAELVAINSINPAYTGGVGEARVAEYVERFFAARGLATIRQEVLPGRWNVLVKLAGRDATRRVLLEAHMDTVTTARMTIDPFRPVIEDGRMYGRGSCDTKAGLATMMHAVASLQERGVVPACEVWLAAVVDEEHGFLGVQKLCEDFRAEAAIVAEPTELRAVGASKGVLRWKVRTIGVSAHSSTPHLGVSAITNMTRVLAAIEEENVRMAARPHPLLGPGTMSVGLIAGGEQINFVPDRCEISIDRRLLPGETPEDIWRAMGHRFAALGFPVEMDRPMIAVSPLETGAETGVARVAQEVLRGMGLESTLAGVPFGSDASELARVGVPSLIFGPGSIDRAHAAVEYVEIDQVVAALAFQTAFLERYE